jgi:hypothetical protein
MVIAGIALGLAVLTRTTALLYVVPFALLPLATRRIGPAIRDRAGHSRQRDSRQACGMPPAELCRQAAHQLGTGSSGDLRPAWREAEASA